MDDTPLPPPQPLAGEPVKSPIEPLRPVEFVRVHLLNGLTMEFHTGYPWPEFVYRMKAEGVILTTLGFVPYHAIAMIQNLSEEARQKQTLQGNNGNVVAMQRPTSRD